MRKGFLFTVSVILACLALTAGALADYGYTEVSQIPMAKDFSVRVVFNSDGEPVIVTDYPFEETGATEMNLVYGKKDNPEVVTLNYKYPADTTDIGSYDGNLYSHETLSKAYEAIRSGDLTLDDEVYVNTSNFYSGSDWFLAYSLNKKTYTEYKERTHAQAFNGMGSGGVEKAIYYSGGRIDYTRVMKRLENADLLVYRNKFGEITSADIYTYDGGFRAYSYDPSTGLFDGHPITDLGFEESDMEIEALASLGDRTGSETVSTSVSAPAEVPVPDTGRAVFRTTGGLLAGIMIGITVYYLFRRRKGKEKEKVKEAPVTKADAPVIEVPAAEDKAAQPGIPVAEESIEPGEPPVPEEIFDSPAQTMQNH